MSDSYVIYRCYVAGMEFRRILQKCEAGVCIHDVLKRQRQTGTAEINARKDLYIHITPEGDAHYPNEKYAILGCTVNLYSQTSAIRKTQSTQAVNTGKHCGGRSRRFMTISMSQ